MSDESNKETPALGTPAWMQSQTPTQPDISPKSKRTRRTRAQMAEARAAKLGSESIIPATEVEQISDDTVRLRDTIERRASTPREIARSYFPTMIAVIALAVAIAALAK